MNYPAIDSDASSIFDVPNLTGTPERRLLLAILERALLDFVGNDPNEVSESEAWLFDSSQAPERSEPFTFVWICKELDLDVADIRDKVQAMPKRGANRIAPWYLTKDYARTRKSRLEEKPASIQRERRGDVVNLFSSQSRDKRRLN